MKVYHIQSPTFGAQATQATKKAAQAIIEAADNPGHPFLWNEVKRLVDARGLPAVFGPYKIVLPSVSIDVYRELNTMGIKFSNNKPKTHKKKV